MNMNNIHRIRPIVACVLILCFMLASAGLGVQPVQASPPTSSSLYWLDVWFSSNPPFVCLNETTELEFTFRITSRNPHPSVVPYRFGGFQLSSSLEGTVISMTNKPIPEGLLDMDKEYRIKFDYTPKKTGDETLTLRLDLKVGEKLDSEKAHLSFEVKDCSKYTVHASTDVGTVANSMMPGPGWEYVGTYDIFGTVSVEEDGIHGEGIASTFQVFLWTGEADVDGYCVQEPPWEGAATIDIVGDLSAFADSGMLNLEFFVEPMPINASQITCVDAEGGSGSSPFPASTTPAYTFFSGPIPADGGRITIFEGPFQTDLILSLESDS